MQLRMGEVEKRLAAPIDDITSGKLQFGLSDGSPLGEDDRDRAASNGTDHARDTPC
jgi:hypothetical protein